MNERKPDGASGNFTDNIRQSTRKSEDRLCPSADNDAMSTKIPPPKNEERSRDLSPPHRPWAPNISNTLKAPLLPNVNPESISHAQAHAGICVHLPGSPLMEEGDTIVFHWGLNQSSTRILHAVGFSSTVRVLCVAYNFIAHIQYGLVDVYFEVFRCGKLIGTSPAALVTVNPDESKKARKRNAGS